MIDVKFIHDRGYPFQVKGGDGLARAITICSVMIGEEIHRAHALCSYDDNFSRPVGRKLALTRAIKGLPRETRKEVWAEYWKRYKK